MAEHVHDWLDRQQGAGRYCPGCDTMEWFAVSVPTPLDVGRLAQAVHSVYCRDNRPMHSAADHSADAIAREYARLAAPQPVPEEPPMTDPRACRKADPTWCATHDARWTRGTDRCVRSGWNPAVPEEPT